MKPPEPPTPEDIALIEPNIILPLVLAALKRDRDVFNAPGLFKTPAPYTAAIDLAIERLTADLDVAKRKLYRRGIRITAIEPTVARYLCRGYSGELAVDISVGTDVMRTYLPTLSDTNAPAP